MKEGNYKINKWEQKGSGFNFDVFTESAPSRNVCINKNKNIYKVPLRQQPEPRGLVTSGQRVYC